MCLLLRLIAGIQNQCISVLSYMPFTFYIPKAVYDRFGVRIFVSDHPRW